MFGNDRIPDTATVSAYDGMHLIYQVIAKLGPKFNPDDAMKVMSEMKFDSPRGPIMIDPKTRDIVQNVYLRRVKEQGGTTGERELPHGSDGQGPVEGGESVSLRRLGTPV